MILCQFVNQKVEPGRHVFHMFGATRVRATCNLHPSRKDMVRMIPQNVPPQGEADRAVVVIEEQLLV